jgi:protein phosphatase
VVSTVGNVREHNEDNFYVPGRASLRNGPPFAEDRISSTWDEDPLLRSTAETLQPASSSVVVVDGPENLFIVADGMGGQLAGEKASQMAVELIPLELKKRLSPSLDDKAHISAIKDSIAKTNDEILVLSHLGAEHANMGTTVVLILFANDRAYVVGIGDSRAYRYRDGKLDQLTKDHSLANALGEAGTIRPEEVESHKFRHVLYLYLGSKEARDSLDEIRIVDVRPGDQFLLATDGLMNVVRDDMIADILRQTADPQWAAQTLVNRALEYGSKDNITSLVIHVAS